MSADERGVSRNDTASTVLSLQPTGQPGGSKPFEQLDFGMLVGPHRVREFVHHLGDIHLNCISSPL